MQTLTFEEMDQEAGFNWDTAWANALGYGATTGGVVKFALRGASVGRVGGLFGIAAGVVIGGAVGFYLGGH